MELFRGLPPDDLDALADAFQCGWVAPGRVVIEQGAQDTDFCVLVAGALLGTTIAPDGRQIGCLPIRAGDFFGQLSALDGLPRSMNVAATAPALVARLPGAVFRHWLEVGPGVAVALSMALCAHARMLDARVFTLGAHDVATRLRHLLCDLAREAGAFRSGGTIQPAPTHEVLASHVCANRESVSRELARLARAGTIETGRRKIVIRDVAALCRGL